MRRMVAAVLLATLAAAVSGQTYYKWTDAHGVTHYSEQRPSTVKAQPLRFHSGQPAPVAAATVTPPPEETSEALRVANEDFTKRACATAQENLRLLSGNAAVLDTGTLQHPADVTTATQLSTEQRVAATVQAQQQINQYCDGK